MQNLLYLLLVSGCYLTSSLRVMQFNTEWLFLDQYNDCPGQGCTWSNLSEAEIHMDKVLDTVNNVNADIINICEVEGLTELNTLKNSSNVEYDVYFTKGKDTSTGQNVGMLSNIVPTNDLNRTDERYNYPVKGSNCACSSSGSEGVSKNQFATFTVGDFNILLIGAHFLSNPVDSTRCCLREAQAQVIQNVISEYIGNNYEIILMGDFNDFDKDILDINDNAPISMVLDILKGNEGEHNYELHSVGQLIDKRHRFSDWWDVNGDCITTPDEFSVLDHVLVSNNLYNKISSAFFYHGYNEICGKYDSDHYPLVVDFDI